MDRRTFLAFILAGLVLIGWSILFPVGHRPGPDGGRARSPESVGVRSAAQPVGEGRPGGGTPGDRGAGSTTTAPTGGGEAAFQAAEGSAEPAAGEPAWAPAPVESVRVETDLLVARIHTHGGGLTGLELKAFPSGHVPGPVDLVRAGHEALDVGLRSDGRETSFAGAPFAVSRQTRDEQGTRVEDVVLIAQRDDGLQIRRTYTFRDGSYEVKHSVEVAGIPGGAAAPELEVGWRSGIPYTEAIRTADEQYFSAILRVGDEVQTWRPGKFRQGPRRIEGTVRWVAVSNKYFLAALVPAPGTATAAVAEGDPTSFRNAVAMSFPLAAASGGRVDLALYLGPKDLERLKALDVGLGDAVSLGYRWMRPLSQLMVAILKATHRVLPNYGVVIIVLSAAVRLLLYPLNRTSLRSMKAMQRLQPEMEAIKKKHASNPQELNKQVMQLYQKHGVNPLGGCLPVVVQMPVLFALYFSLMFSIDLRRAPFGLWIRDLSAPDTIGHVSGFPIHVLPLIMTVVSVLQARSAPRDPRQAAMTTMMPIMFLAFFYNMPSGLVLYWTVTNLFTWAQQVIVNRADAAPAGAVGQAVALAAGGGDDRSTGVGRSGGSARDRRVASQEAGGGEDGPRDGGGGDGDGAPGEGAVVEAREALPPPRRRRRR